MGVKLLLVYQRCTGDWRLQRHQLQAQACWCRAGPRVIKLSMNWISVYHPSNPLEKLPALPSLSYMPDRPEWNEARFVLVPKLLHSKLLGRSVCCSISSDFGKACFCSYGLSFRKPLSQKSRGLAWRRSLERKKVKKRKENLQTTADTAEYLIAHIASCSPFSY